MTGKMPAGGDTLSSSSLSPEAGRKILAAYFAILDKCAPPSGCVADLGGLPYSKREIKDAIVAGMADGTDARARLRLRSAYLALADWQEGVGDRPLALTLLTVPAADPDHSNPDRASTAPGLVNMDRWNIAVVDERRQLVQELRALGFDSL